MQLSAKAQTRAFSGLGLWSAKALHNASVQKDISTHRNSEKPVQSGGTPVNRKETDGDVGKSPLSTVDQSRSKGLDAAERTANCHERDTGAVEAMSNALNVAQQTDMRKATLSMLKYRNMFAIANYINHPGKDQQANVICYKYNFEVRCIHM